MRSNFYTGSKFGNVQFGLENLGLLRLFPYTPFNIQKISQTCQIQQTQTEECLNEYLTSACGNKSIHHFYPFNAHCQGWYQQGRVMTSVTTVGYGYPRITATSAYVLTPVVPIHQNNQDNGQFLGTFASNYYISDLKSSISNLQVLYSGFSYLVDAKSPNYVIVHPKATNKCTLLSCLETKMNMTAAEFIVFNLTVLERIKNNEYDQIATSYFRAGQKWAVHAIPVQSSYVHYAFIITVPESEVLQPATNIQSAINKGMNKMLIIFICVIAAVFVFLLLFTAIVVKGIINPINDLRRIFYQVKNKDYSGRIAERASSSDMRILLSAFSKLIIALKLSADDVTPTNMSSVKSVYTDASKLFTVTNNSRGLGVSFNNLAAAELSLGNQRRAIELYQHAVENAKTLFASAKNTPDEERAKRVLNDREGNLAIAFMEDSSKMSEAMKILQRVAEDDKKENYALGYIRRQLALARCFIRQGDYKAAAKGLLTGLSYIQSKSITVKKDKNDSNRQDDSEKAMFYAAEQIGLYGFAIVQEAINRGGINYSNESSVKTAFDEVEAKYLEALVKPPNMHPAITKQILFGLKNIYFNSSDRNADEEDIDRLINDLGLDKVVVTFGDVVMEDI